jgi:autotransporter-associated beta strand protein
MFACTGLVRAADGFWTANAGGNWNTATNWNLSEIPSAGANASFNGPAPSTAYTANSTITVDTSPVLGTLIVSKLGAAFTSTFSGSGNQVLTLNNGITTDLGASLTISQGSGLNTLPILLGGNNAWALFGTAGAITVSSIIDDAANSYSITKTGTRSLSLSGANTFDGGIVHRQGTINIGGIAAATVLGNGTFTFGNIEGTPASVTLALNAGVSKTFTNNFVNDNAENNDAGQVAQISTSGGSNGYRTLTFNTGTFATGLNYNANQGLNLNASTGSTALSEGAYFFNGSWAGYAAGANNSAIRIGAGSVVLNSNAVAASGGYSINGNDAAMGAKLILATSGTTMANRVEFAGAANGMRSSFGARHASGTSTQSGGLSITDADGGNIFSQSSGATLAIGGAISGAGPLRINDRYTFTSADTINSLETPAGTVAFTNSVSSTNSGGITVVNGTLRVNGDAAVSGTGSGTVNVGIAGAAVSAQAGAAVINSRVITGVTTATAQTLQIGQSITGTNIPVSSIITGITIGNGASNSTVVINNIITPATPDVQFATTAFTSTANLGGTGRIAPTVPNGVLVNTGSSVSLVDGITEDLLIRFVASADPLAAPGTATFSTGSTFAFELAEPGTGDRIDFSGLLTTGAGAGGGGSVVFNNNVVNFAGLPGIDAGEYTLFTFSAAGKYSGNLVAGTLPAGISSAVFDYSDPLAIKVTLTAGTSPYTTWANGFLPADVSNPAGDNDNDGLVNQQEFAFGLNPLSGSSVNPVTVPLNKATGTFRYTRLAASGLTYKVFKSTTLSGFTVDAGATATQTFIGSASGVDTYEVTLSGTKPLTDTKLFVRIAAE